MGTLKTTNIQSISGSGTVTLGTSGETFTVPSGVTVAGGLANTPAFSAYLSADQTGIVDSTWTKVAMNTEFYDTDSAYNTSTYRFTVPTGQAGKYCFLASMYIEGSNTVEDASVGFYKNGTKVFYKENAVDNKIDAQIYATIDLAAADYVELYIYMNIASGGTGIINQNGTTTNNRVYWYGYKLIGV
jgi:hypothetical protein